MRGVFESM